MTPSGPPLHTFDTRRKGSLHQPKSSVRHSLAHREWLKKGLMAVWSPTLESRERMGVQRTPFFPMMVPTRGWGHESDCFVRPPSPCSAKLHVNATPAALRRLVAAMGPRGEQWEKVGKWTQGEKRGRETRGVESTLA
eukprot:525455-Prorocentrum_minimum.AAC.1